MLLFGFFLFIFVALLTKGLHNGSPRLPPHSGMSPGRPYMPPYHPPGTPTGMRPMTGGYAPPTSMLPGHHGGAPQGSMSPYSLTPRPPAQGGGAVPPNMCYSISPPSSLSASGLSALQEMLRRPFNSPSPGVPVSASTAEFHPTLETGRVRLSQKQDFFESFIVQQNFHSVTIYNCKISERSGSKYIFYKWPTRMKEKT